MKHWSKDYYDEDLITKVYKTVTDTTINFLFNGKFMSEEDIVSSIKKITEKFLDLYQNYQLAVDEKYNKCPVYTPFDTEILRNICAHEDIIFKFYYNNKEKIDIRNYKISKNYYFKHKCKYEIDEEYLEFFENIKQENLKVIERYKLDKLIKINKKQIENIYKTQVSSWDYTYNYDYYKNKIKEMNDKKEEIEKKLINNFIKKFGVDPYYERNPFDFTNNIDSNLINQFNLNNNKIDKIINNIEISIQYLKYAKNNGILTDNEIINIISEYPDFEDSIIKDKFIRKCKTQTDEDNTITQENINNDYEFFMSEFLKFKKSYTSQHKIFLENNENNIDVLNSKDIELKDAIDTHNNINVINNTDIELNDAIDNNNNNDLLNNKDIQINDAIDIKSNNLNFNIDKSISKKSGVNEHINKITEIKNTNFNTNKLNNDREDTSNEYKIPHNKNNKKQKENINISENQNNTQDVEEKKPKQVILKKNVFVFKINEIKDIKEFIKNYKNSDLLLDLVVTISKEENNPSLDVYWVYVKLKTKKSKNIFNEYLKYEELIKKNEYFNLRNNIVNKGNCIIDGLNKIQTNNNLTEQMDLD